MTNSQLNGNAVAPRRGSQTPRLERIPDYVATAADDAIDLMALTGNFCDPWQRRVLDGAMGLSSHDRWSAFEVGLVVPRQNGKNFILEARELAGLFFFEERNIIHTAHRLDATRKAFRDMENKIRSTPAFLKRVQGYRGQDPWDPRIPGIRTGAGEMSIQLANGCKIDYKTRSRGAGRSFTADLVVIDEALYLDADFLAELMPVMASRSQSGNPQIWYTSTAGLPESEQLARIRERGLTDDDSRFAYFEWSAPDSVASDDVDAWYQANPSLGLRISEDYIRETEYQDMGDEQFRRERLGIWAPLGGQSAISVGAWKKVLDSGSSTGQDMFFALDVPPSRDTASIGVASTREDGFIHVELADRRVGTDWVPGRLRELQDRWHPHLIVIEAGSAAGALIPQIRRAGVRIKQVDSRSYYQACGMFYDAVQQNKIRHTGQEELDDAVGAAQMRFVGDSLFKWNRKTREVDISPLAAVTLAVYGLLTDRRTGKDSQRENGWKVVAL